MLKTPAMLFVVVAAALPRPSPSPSKRAAHGVVVGQQSAGQSLRGPPVEVAHSNKRASINQIGGAALIKYGDY